MKNKDFYPHDKLYLHRPVVRPQNESSSISTNREAAGLPLRCQPGRQWVEVSCQETKCPKACGNHSLL